MLFVVVYRVEMLYIASEVMVSDTRVPSIIVIGTAINLKYHKKQFVA